MTDEEVEWKNLDAFGLSDLRTKKKGQESQVSGMDYEPMELDLTGSELRSRLNTGSGGQTINPEIPILDGTGSDLQYCNTVL